MHMQGLAADILCPAFGPPLEVRRAIANSDITAAQIIHEFGHSCHLAFPPRGAARATNCSRLRAPPPARSRDCGRYDPAPDPTARLISPEDRSTPPTALPNLPYSLQRNRRARVELILPYQVHSLPVLRCAQCANRSTPPNANRRCARRTSSLLRGAGSARRRS